MQVRFEAGNYQVGDYWLIPARTINNVIEWPVFPDGSPQPVRRFGIDHHITCLASFLVNNVNNQQIFDCRKRFVPLTQISPVVETEPSPGQFRYYLIDSTDGSDQSGQPGIGASAPEAFSRAVAFQTVGHAIAQISRDGHSSTAVILIKPAQTAYDDLILDGVTGYHKIVIRGSYFDDFTTDSQSTLPKVSGAIKQSTVLTASPDFGAINQNVLPINRESSLGDEPALIGQRVRLEGSDDCNMVLGIDKSSGHNDIILGSDSVLPPERWGSGLPGDPGRFVQPGGAGRGRYRRPGGGHRLGGRLAGPEP